MRQKFVPTISLSPRTSCSVDLPSVECGGVERLEGSVRTMQRGRYLETTTRALSPLKPSSRACVQRDGQRSRVTPSGEKALANPACKKKNASWNVCQVVQQSRPGCAIRHDHHCAYRYDSERAPADSDKAMRYRRKARRRDKPSDNAETERQAKKRQLSPHF